MLAMTVIPIIRLQHLSAEQAQLFMIAENKFSDRSSFDVPALAELFRDLSVLGLDLSLEISGCETGEIDLMIQGLDFAPVEDVDASELQSGPAVSKLGDLWILSYPTSGLVHRLYVGDALQAASYAALMGGMRVRAVITDPPFGGKIEDYLPGNGRIKHREFVSGSEGRTPEELEQLLDSACVLIREACAPGALVYIFMDWRGIRVLLGVGDRVFGDLKNIIAWVKTQPGMGSFYRSQHELIALFKVEGGPHKNNIQLGKFGRSRSNVWTYPGMTSFNGRHTMEGDLLALHPTAKSVDMIAEAILDCTERGDIVLDPFLGSGTTLIAAERTGRRAYGIELDSLYCDVAVRRWLRLHDYGACDRMFFICHSPNKALLARAANPAPGVELWFAETVAEKAIRAGLFEWLIERVQ